VLALLQEQQLRPCFWLAPDASGRKQPRSKLWLCCEYATESQFQSCEDSWMSVRTCQLMPANPTRLTDRVRTKRPPAAIVIQDR